MKIFVFFLILSAQIQSIYGDENLKFNILPFGISQKEAKIFLNENNVNIKNEYTFINDNSIRNVIVIEGTFYREYCEIRFHFVDGFLSYGEYEFRDTRIRNIPRIKENLIEDLSREFRKAPSLKYMYGEYLEWEFPNGLIVELYDFGHHIIILYLLRK